MTTRAYIYGSKGPRSEVERVLEQLCLAHRYANVLVEIEKERRSVAVTEADAATKTAANEKAAARVREERARCGVYWGTYLQIEASAQQSRRSKKEPRFRRWDGTGTVAVQFPYGISMAQLFNGDDRKVRLLGDGSHRVLWLRVGSVGKDGSGKGGAPIWAEFPMVYHRDLPADARIRVVKAVCRRVGVHYKWSVQFVCDKVPSALLPAPDRDTLAIDVGWRRIDVGMRVARWVDDQGLESELVVGQEWLDRISKVDDLRSIRDLRFGDARRALIEWLRDHDQVSEPLERARENLPHWRAPARLAALVIRWRRERFAGDEEIYEIIEAWRKQDKHLLCWESHQRERTLRRRREAYRIFARFVARYRRVVIEDLDLRVFAELPARGPDVPIEDPRTTAARPRRFLAALSELLGAIADAVDRAGGTMIEANPANTTRTCHDCGAVNNFDAAGSIMHTCIACGATWDQDANAARNLLRAVQHGEIKPSRSKRQKRVIIGDTPAAQRRAKGLATRRARRSTATSQVLETTRVI